MEREKIKAIVENLLLAADQPVSPETLQQVLADGTSADALRDVLEELRGDYESGNLQIVEVAEGYQIGTRSEYFEWIRRLLKLDKTFRLSQPALDTLSIIAYKQPLTRAEVEEIRGVDSSGVVKTLLEKKIIVPAGRKEVPGKPIMYKTSKKFLEYFGLRDLGELPTLEDFSEEIEGDDTPQQGELLFGAGAGAAASGDTEPATPNDASSADRRSADRRSAEPPANDDSLA
ncbi:SMC-Scp complex subunit ScpB [Nitrospina watsonii]|uniref:Segregation and condensation protein B n=1 Tax=Nitrospina watsonii TaxID=1323948 RepID=A0ABM9HAQ5_9BACT|nr:SMC-Scp complex subunit ScpB [Nitrospina watsonii]CAI2717239.1 Segregation and condensation protein B [Nitrospina watsonii]